MHTVVKHCTNDERFDYQTVQVQWIVFIDGEFDSQRQVFPLKQDAEDYLTGKDFEQMYDRYSTHRWSGPHGQTATVCQIMEEEEEHWVKVEEQWTKCPNCGVGFDEYPT